jgi:hypothetical protein
LGGKIKGKRPVGRPGCRWKETVEMYPREVVSGSVDWIDLAQDRDHRRVLMYAVMEFLVPQNIGKYLWNCVTGCFPELVRNVS